MTRAVCNEQNLASIVGLCETPEVNRVGDARSNSTPVSSTAGEVARRIAGVEKTPDVLHRRVQDIASAFPDRLAVCDDAQSLSYGELDARANALAHHLRARGVRPGVRVGLCQERGVDLGVGAVATLKAGGADVGLG